MENQDRRDELRAVTDPALFYESAPCGYLSFAADGELIRVNDTLCQWLGYKRKDMEFELYFTELLSKGGRLYYEMFYLPLLRLQENVNEINFELMRKDTSRFPVLVNSVAIRDSEGILVAVNATIFDITDRKQYERQLLDARKLADQERSRFEFLSDFLPEMIWMADGDGMINYGNHRLRDFFGVTEEKLSAQLILRQIHHQDRLKLLLSWKRAVDAETNFLTEVRLESGLNSYRWFQVRALPIGREEGRSEKWIGSCTDVDAHVKHIVRLDEFISVASHELKTPITSLKASFQLLERLLGEHADKPISMLMGQAGRSIAKINTLVDELLNTSQLNQGQMVLDIKPFRLADLLGETCQHVRAEGKYKLRVICESEILVNADEHRIDQVLINFVNNAIKYAPGSSDITIRAQEWKGKVRVAVEDQGPGIPSVKQPYLFDRYYRVDHNGSKYSGLGLGL